MDDTIKPKTLLGLSRREFLYYAWLGSMGLLAAEGAGLLVWYGLSKPIDNKFNGIYIINDLPRLAPVYYRDSNFWLAPPEAGLIAFFIECPVRRTVYKWVDVNHRFECPSCGSKFQMDGTYIEGPSHRNLDRFALTIYTTEGTLESNEAGDPIPVDLDTIKEVWVNTAKVILGQARSSPLRR